METIAYEIERNHHGYGVYELTLEDGVTKRREKIIEHDFLVIALNKLSNLLFTTLPDTLKTSTPTGEAVPAKADQATTKKYKREL
jgi:hypothetical protein